MGPHRHSRMVAGFADPAGRLGTDIRGWMARLAQLELRGKKRSGASEDSETLAPPAMNFSLNVHWVDGGQEVPDRPVAGPKMSGEKGGDHSGNPDLTGRFRNSICHDNDPEKKIPAWPGRQKPGFLTWVLS
jgi:hypothetical protein